MNTENTEQRWYVIENTPGYLPDLDEPYEYNTYEEAVGGANALADELVEQGYECDRSWASRENTYAIRCERPGMVAPDLGRNIEVIRSDFGL